MKKGFKIIAVILGLFISQFGYAGTKESLETEVISPTSFKVRLTEATGSIQLKLRDQSGVILYREVIQGGNNYHKVFNVASLSVGRYQLELEYSTSIQLLPLEVTYSGIIMDDQDLINLFKPFVRQNESRVSINVLNTQRKPLGIKVYDSGDQLVYHDHLAGELLMGKQYDFSELDSGSYRMVLTSNNRSYFHDVSVE
jgi:hypothetical protein